MSGAESILLGLIITLALGSYGYTFLLGRDLRQDLAKLWEQITNHQAHRFEEIERRLNELELTREREHNE